MKFLSSIELNAKRCLFCEENNERLTGLMGKIIYLTFFTEKSKISDFLKYDIEKITAAYDYAAKLHEGQYW